MSQKFTNPALAKLDEQFAKEETEALAREEAARAAKDPEFAKRLAAKAAEEAAAAKAAEEAAAAKKDEEDDKTPPETKTVLADDDIDALLDGKEIKPPEKKVEEPAGGEGVRQLRNRLKEVQAELETVRKQATESTTPYQKEVEELRTKLAQYDIQHDPTFVSKYDEPLRNSMGKMERILLTAGVPRERVSTLVASPLSTLNEALKELPAYVQGAVYQQHLEISELADRRAAAVADARNKQSELAEIRKQQEQQTQGKVLKIRDEVFRNTAKRLAREGGEFFAAADEGSVKVLKDTLLRAKAAIEGAYGEAPTDTVTRQVEFIFKGARFDALAAEHLKLKQELAELRESAERHGFARETPGKGGRREDGGKPRSAEDLSHDEALEALKSRQFASGGRYATA